MIARSAALSRWAPRVELSNCHLKSSSFQWRASEYPAEPGNKIVAKDSWRAAGVKRPRSYGRRRQPGLHLQGYSVSEITHRMRYAKRTMHRALERVGKRRLRNASTRR